MGTQSHQVNISSKWIIQYIFWLCLFLTLLGINMQLDRIEEREPATEIDSKLLNQLEYGLILNRDYTITIIDLSTKRIVGKSNIDSLGYNINKLQE